ncbi:hypothetical protein [Stenotrophomonas pavanii]|uniref:hypothetical protein n=1 Tax=Stenotrophomonas pavanii TaxID=487698 RepID=UPI0039C5E0CE
MASKTPLVLNQVTARVEELAAADTIPGFMVEGLVGRNIVINGDFRFWQRGTGFTATGYGADRFLNNINGITCSMTRLALGVGELAGFKYACRMAFNGGSDPAHYATLQHRLESLGYYSGKTLTFSGYMRANTAGVKVAFECALIAAGGTIPGGVPSTAIGVTTFTLGTSWQKFTATFTVPSLVGATLNDNSALSFNIWLSAGSNHNARTNNLGFQSAVVDFVGLQLEDGGTATGFEYRPDALEQALCQRYYEKSLDVETAPAGNLPSGYTVGTAIAAGTCRSTAQTFKVAKRSNPAITLYTNSAVAAGIGFWGLFNGSSWSRGAASALEVNTAQFHVNLNFGSGLTTFFSYLLGGHWTADAEL